MQISLSKFLGILVGIVGVGMFAYFGYFSYDLFFKGDTMAEIPVIESINVGLLGPKIQKAAGALINKSDKISLKKKDITFTESKLYKSFTDIPDSVPLSESRGRADPFVPYVAP